MTNSGALSANTIKVNTEKLLNGLTDNHTPTSATTVPGQVISLAAGGTPVVPHGVTVNKVAPDVATVITAQTAAATGASNAGTTPAATTGASAGPDVTYLKHNAGDDLLGGVSPADLVNNLPANLKPDTGVQFYADPVIEQQLLTQAALQQTGQAYFVNGLSYDDQTKASVADQQKGILYGNAINWAEQNQVQLGTALSADQIAGLTGPMLWYVEQAVPDPACSGLPSCGTVTVLMPQVYLPTADQSTLAKQEGGSITGNNVTIAGLNGGKASSVTNTGSITGVSSLNIDTQSLTNQARSVDIGVSTSKVDGGWVQTSGTQVQPGGFITSANLNVTADTVQSIGGAFQVLNASGEVDPAASAQFVQDLGAKLGVNYSSTAVGDDIHQDFIKDSSGPGMVVTMVAAIAISVVTYGAASQLVMSAAVSEMGASAAATSTFAAASVGVTQGLANAVIAGAISGMASAAGTQILTAGSLNAGGIFRSGLAGALTAGVSNEIGSAYGVGSVLATGAAGCASAEITGGECATGFKMGAITGALLWAGSAMRSDQITSSEPKLTSDPKFAGVVDADDPTQPIVNNKTGPSIGIDGDNVKLGGTRISLDDLKQFGDVTQSADGTWTFEGRTYLDSASGLMKRYSLTSALDAVGGPTGGAQGLPGTLFNYPYTPGSIGDVLVESFAGPHDFLGSLTAYDALGNLKPGLTGLQRTLFDIQTDIDIPIAGIFAIPTFLNQYGTSIPTLRQQATDGGKH
ncbi:hypothetical protein [Amantichitinum ursilacus]|uniref:Filamentous hemagglutinin n=1 Tax=Amantichitinum ursilacus TaxID=857265 RepID=A0A0N0XKN6_9NEIS|nr:hypothetical protein [Amantichitinum ursilacus]KPC52546.1 hypothetical protein WG78_11900 [Amantichitinum ursilacus]